MQVECSSKSKWRCAGHGLEQLGAQGLSWARRDGPLALGMEVRLGDEGLLLPIDVLLPQSTPCLFPPVVRPILISSESADSESDLTFLWLASGQAHAAATAAAVWGLVLLPHAAAAASSSTAARHVHDRLRLLGNTKRSSPCLEPG